MDSVEAVSEGDKNEFSDTWDDSCWIVSNSCSSSFFLDAASRFIKATSTFDEILLKYGEQGNDEEVYSFLMCWWSRRDTGGVEEWLTEYTVWLGVSTNDDGIIWEFSISEGTGRISAEVTKSDASEECGLSLVFLPKFKLSAIFFMFSLKELLLLVEATAVGGQTILQVALTSDTPVLIGRGVCKVDGDASFLGPEYSGGGIP